ATLLCQSFFLAAPAAFSIYTLSLHDALPIFMAVIAVGVFTSVSVERATATSYTNRYQAELAVQNGLQAAAKTLAATPTGTSSIRSEEHTSELQSPYDIVCRLLLEKKKNYDSV